MHRLSPETRTRVISALVEGCTIRSTVRMTGVSKRCVMRLLVDLGTVCGAYHDTHCRNLNTKRVQLDEVWTFNYCKARQLTERIALKVPHAGDVWLWVAIDSDSRLALSWLVGTREIGMAYDFVADVASRLRFRPQITSDGYPSYRSAVEHVFGSDVDFATLTKHFSASDTGRFSPGRFIAATKESIKGNPDPAHIATSYVERQNWTLRGMSRRYTRLSNGFSRKIENHVAAVNLNYFVYNYVRIHKTLRTTPAMASGLTTKLWDVSDVVALLVESEKRAA